MEFADIEKSWSHETMYRQLSDEMAKVKEQVTSHQEGAKGEPSCIAPPNFLHENGTETYPSDFPGQLAGIFLVSTFDFGGGPSTRRVDVP